MSNSIEPLILDLVEWVAAEPKAYREVMEAWRTSCPRLTVREDAVDRGYLSREKARTDGRLVTMVAAITAGRAFLQHHGRIQ